VTAVPVRAAATLGALLTCLGAPAGGQQTTSSPHGALAVECAACHRPESWTAIRIGPGFDHARSGFALEGAHAQSPCRACHVSLDFRGTRGECAACHEDVHRAELGPECARCHTPRSFLDRTAMVRRHAQTRLPLDGSHLLADCRACHATAGLGRLTFVAQPVRCEECHLARYATAVPDHRAVGFSTECAQCHSTVDWARARFDHAQVGFPLTGAHRPLSCDACHRNFAFTGGSVACVDCHRQDFDGTTDPNHAAGGIPTDCAACHGTTTWDGARFDHDARWFPIFSGKHQGRWQSCSDCHVSPGDFSQFTCAQCHDQTRMDDKHREIPGYGPTPADCLRCHPTGRKP
jgi:hypothetical protein